MLSATSRLRYRRQRPTIGGKGAMPMKLELIKIRCGDVALIVNDTLVMAADPSLDDVGDVDRVAERLAGATGHPLSVLALDTPLDDAWTWDEIVAERTPGGAVSPSA